MKNCKTKPTVRVAYYPLLTKERVFQNQTWSFRTKYWNELRKRGVNA